MTTHSKSDDQEPIQSKTQMQWSMPALQEAIKARNTEAIWKILEKCPEIVNERIGGWPNEWNWDVGPWPSTPIGYAERMRFDDVAALLRSAREISKAHHRRLAKEREKKDEEIAIEEAKKRQETERTEQEHRIRQELLELRAEHINCRPEIADLQLKVQQLSQKNRQLETDLKTAKLKLMQYEHQESVDNRNLPSL